jgi:hypothetical protein
MMDIQMARPHFQQVNVGAVERRLSLVGGLFTLAYLLARRPRITISLPLLLEAGYMMYRGATGHCMVYQVMDINHATDRPTGERQPDRRLDPVELASEDSFPASDPPGWVSSSRIE